MTQTELDPFFKVAAGLCAAFAIVWVFRIRSKGTRAYLMSLAFLLLGTTALLVVQRAPQYLVNISLGLTSVLLVGDFLLRAKEQAERQ